MPLQNRVDPYGKLNAVAARGAWMGNRGILHDDQNRIVAPWRLKRWITCTLSFKDRKRTVFSPHRYSELFFLDEATAFAAGHRPCAECRRREFNAFRAAWIAANGTASNAERLSADAMDNVLHAERAIRGAGKRTYAADLRELPDGTMIELDGVPLLIWNNHYWRWSFQGYSEPMPASEKATTVVVLTPKSLVRLFAGGLRPQVHESVRG
jgi:hypothetical protein